MSVSGYEQGEKMSAITAESVGILSRYRRVHLCRKKFTAYLQMAALLDAKIIIIIIISSSSSSSSSSSDFKGSSWSECTSESQSKYVMTPSLTFIIAVILHGNPIGSMRHPLYAETEHDANTAFSPYFTWLPFQ